VPSKPVALLLLGLTPLMTRLMPARLRPNPDSFVQGAANGSVCMMLMLLTGVTGPMIDSFFLGGRLERRQIVASKAMCQVFGHSMKLVYFGSLIDQAGSLDPKIAVLAVVAAMIGTSLAARVLDAMTDAQFRNWANGIITAICVYYVAQATVLFVWTDLARAQ
jgi:uncharacterized protein